MSRIGRVVHEEAAESYFASVSDLMVGILFIFLLMLTVFALNFADEDKDAEIRRLHAELEQKTAELQTLQDKERARDAALLALSGQIGAFELDIDTARDRLRITRAELLHRLQVNLANRGVSVEISAQQDVLRLPSEEIFALGSASFTPRGQERVSAVLDELSRLLPCYADYRDGAAPASCSTAAPIFETVLIEGHTDALPADNWRLSTDRARAVLDIIQRQFAGLAVLRNPANQPLLGLAGYGDSRTLPTIPVTDARNRRIELRFLLAAAPEQEARALRDKLEELRARLDGLRSR